MSSDVVWDRAEPPERPSPAPLSRARIVGAAIALADAEGLASVSLRKVGAALDAGPMRLYGYVATKEELLELMVDAIYGEMAARGPLRGDWRKVLRAIAQRVRTAAQDHPWFIHLVGGRPNLGPNSLARLEASLAALHGKKGFEDIDWALQAVFTVEAYVIGAIRREASERHAELETGMDEPAWQRASAPYMERMIATGRFPTLASVVRDAAHPPLDVAFERGLDIVLDGVAARIER